MKKTNTFFAASTYLISGFFFLFSDRRAFGSQHQSEPGDIIREVRMFRAYVFSQSIGWEEQKVFSAIELISMGRSKRNMCATLDWCQASIHARDNLFMEISQIFQEINWIYSSFSVSLARSLYPNLEADIRSLWKLVQDVYRCEERNVCETFLFAMENIIHAMTKY